MPLTVTRLPLAMAATFEAPLQMSEVLVVLSEDEAGEAIVVEGEDDLGLFDDAGMQAGGVPSLLCTCGRVVRWAQMPLL